MLSKIAVTSLGALLCLCAGHRASAQTVTSGSASVNWSYSFNLGDVYQTSAYADVNGTHYAATTKFDFMLLYLVYDKVSDSGSFTIPNGLNFSVDIDASSSAVGTTAPSAGATCSASGSVTWHVTGIAYSTVRITYTASPYVTRSGGVSSYGSEVFGGAAYAGDGGGDVLDYTISDFLTHTDDTFSPSTQYKYVTLNSNGEGDAVITFSTNAHTSDSVSSSGSAGGTVTSTAGITYVTADYI